MVESTQAARFTPEEYNRLQQLRSAVLGLQDTVAPLAADTRSDVYSEQFNQLRLETKALLKDPEFDQKAPRAITENAWMDRSQKIIFPRLSAITFIGVILALIGLGVNSIVLEDVVVNSVGCCVSSGGMLLIMGAFGVWGLVNTRRRVTNLGDLYQHCDALLVQIDHILDIARFDRVARPGESQFPSAAELRLGSLRAQVAYWQEKLRGLESQRQALEPDAPPELINTIEYMQQEVNQVRQELARLQGQETATAGQTQSPPSSGARVIVPGGAQIEVKPVSNREFDSQAVSRARLNTIDMPPLNSEEGAMPAAGEASSDDEEETDSR